jgi:ribosomal protein L16 Arg81 hydroxylase
LEAGAAVVLTRLLGGFPAGRFLEEFYNRLPHSRPGGAKDVTPPLDWDRIRALLEAPGADVLLSRQGRLWEGRGTPSFEEARRLHAEGYTITLRGAERHDPSLGRLAREFQEDFRAPVNIHVTCTPSGGHGFGWHYDVEDVFILQAGGIKEYSLRKNTVNPWPVLETMPRDLRFEEEGSPVFTCRLEAGDWLYIPAGWWHVAKTERESMSLAVGLMTPPAADVIRFLEPELRSSVVWRRRLPVAGSANPGPPEALLEEYARLFRELGRDLAAVMSDPKLARKYLEARAGPKGDP